jgi:hypothetical protein
VSEQPEWQVTGGPYLPPRPPEDWEAPLQWPHDGYVALLTGVLVVLLGPPVGLLWSNLAPKLALAKVVAGAEGPFKSMVGADAWFLLVSALAGVLCAVVAVAARGDGPGVVVGLAVGGLAAAFIADRVGYLAARGHTLKVIHDLGLTPGQFQIDVFFKVRALGVLVAWPLASVVVHAAIVAFRGRRP